GGVIATERRDGFALEHGPESFITDKPWGLDLARRLRLEEQLVGTRPEHRRSFVVRNGKLLPVPEGFQILAPSRFGPLVRTPIFSWPGKARMALDLLLPPRRDGADESLGGFVLRRLGREALDRMAQPMIAGIYGADPMELSLEATLPRFVEMERMHGSVIRGMWARQRSVAGKATLNGVSGARYGLFVSFREGMQALTDALAARIGAERILLNTPVQALRREGEAWRLQTPAAELETDALILALPAYRSAALLRPVEPELAALLESIRYASAGTLNLCYRREDVPHPLDGFGFVVPRVEGLTILGCTFSDVKWPGRVPEGYALLRAFLGDAALARHSPGELEGRAREDLRRLLGVSAKPRFRLFWKGERCMPQYAVGHLERVEQIEGRAAALRGLALAGNAFRGVGIPDCIRSAEAAAERALAC
ncbi:MAG TPA: protoporphyrinogen oxidase, partial [Armatimonadota bacterium]|nr:protoporphyrinogen oxidase [Armatimonadota bacterium]